MMANMNWVKIYFPQKSNSQEKHSDTFLMAWAKTVPVNAFGAWVRLPTENQFQPKYPLPKQCYPCGKWTRQDADTGTASEQWVFPPNHCSWRKAPVSGKIPVAVFVYIPHTIICTHMATDNQNTLNGNIFTVWAGPITVSSSFQQGPQAWELDVIA